MLLIGLSVLLAILLKYFLAPHLPQQLQSTLIWLGGASILSLTILSGLAQLTGFSLKDFLFPEKRNERVQNSRNLEGAIILNSESSGNINWTGNVFQDKSTKINVEHVDVIDNHDKMRKNKIDSQIQEIQKNLYSENKLIPYILTLCLDLNDQLGMGTEYHNWINKELNGFEDYSEYVKKFDNVEELNAWMERWFSHRLINTYIKVSMASEHQKEDRIEELQYEKIFVAFPIAKLSTL